MAVQVCSNGFEQFLAILIHFQYFRYLKYWKWIKLDKTDRNYFYTLKFTTRWHYKGVQMDLNRFEPFYSTFSILGT